MNKQSRRQHNTVDVKTPYTPITSQNSGGTIFNPTSCYGLTAWILPEPLIPFTSCLTIMELYGGFKYRGFKYGGFKRLLVNDSTFQK